MMLESPAGTYQHVYDMVKQSASHPSPRGRKTVEIMSLNLEFYHPEKCMIFEDEDMIDYIESEIRTVKSGEPPERKAPQELIDKLDLEEDGTFFEQGIRDAVSHNWDMWTTRLRQTQDTRKCAATFTHPKDDNPPCTISMQFLYRHGELHLITYNRSQDMTFAYKMDCALFGTLLSDMAEEVGADVGHWYHNIGSAHIYESDLE